MIEVKNLVKSFGKNDEIKVLKGIDITIEKGEKVVVIGPSGGGKSTFLRCLNCMEDPTGGQIIFNGVDIADFSVDINIHRRKMGVVFHHLPRKAPRATPRKHLKASPQKVSTPHLVPKTRVMLEAPGLPLPCCRTSSCRKRLENSTAVWKLPMK